MAAINKYISGGSNIIVINRGDTFSFDLSISDDSQESGRYILQGNDAVYFGIMDPNQWFENALVKKKYTTEDTDEQGNLIITIDAEDTLDLFPGKYYYAIKLKIDHYDDILEQQIEKIDTIINKTKFIICD